MEQQIQFISNYSDWVSVKKLKIDEKTDAKSIMEFLASLTMGIDNKVEGNLRKIVDLGRVDAALNEIDFGKGEAGIAKALASLNSRAVTGAIKEICELERFQKNEQKELMGFCKAYAARKALKESGLMVDYSEIEIPGMKRLKRMKNK